MSAHGRRHVRHVPGPWEHAARLLLTVGVAGGVVAFVLLVVPAALRALLPLLLAL